MEKKKGESQISPTRRKVMMASGIHLLAALASITVVLASAISDLPVLLSVLSFKHRPVSLLVVVLTTVVLSVGPTFVIARRAKGPSRLGNLKDKMSNAYLKALENSTMNPLRGGQE